ncbi:hypothetical protein HN51_030052 [Arachis hypogaea]
MNNQARTLNLNLEFGYDLNHGGAIGVGGAINANLFVSCVDDNFEFGIGGSRWVKWRSTTSTGEEELRGGEAFGEAFGGANGI